MEYGKIISTGWKQAWKYKTLWIFGFFISGGAGGNMSNFSDEFDGFGLKGGDFYHIKEFIIEHMYIIVLLAALAFVALLIWIILGTISTGGIIDAARQLKRNEAYRFGKAIKAGVSYFWRILGVGLLTLVVIFAIIIFLALIGVAAFFIHVGIGIISLLILIPLFIVSIFLTTITVAMAERYIIIENRPVFDSIGDGFNLWKAHLGPSIVYSLIYIGLSIAIGLGTLVIVLFTVMPFVAVAFVNWVVAVVIGVPIVLLILLVVEGFTGSAMNLMTTEFYYQLVELNQPATAQPAVPGSDYSPPPPPPPAP
jgi:hypothetical protein